MIRALITEISGCKIDDEGNLQQLTNLVKSVLTQMLSTPTSNWLTPTSLSTSLKVSVCRTSCNGSTRSQREPPTYLGLPANAEKLLLVGHGKGMIGNLGTITDMVEEGERVAAQVANAA